MIASLWNLVLPETIIMALLGIGLVALIRWAMRDASRRRQAPPPAAPRFVAAGGSAAAPARSSSAFPAPAFSRKSAATARRACVYCAGERRCFQGDDVFQTADKQARRSTLVFFPADALTQALRQRQSPLPNSVPRTALPYASWRFADPSVSSANPRHGAKPPYRRAGERSTGKLSCRAIR